MNWVNSLDSLSAHSDVFYVERSSGEHTSPRPQTPNNLISTELSAVYVKNLITISRITSLEPNIMSIESDTIELTVVYGYGRRYSIFPTRSERFELAGQLFQYSGYNSKSATTNGLVRWKRHSTITSAVRDSFILDTTDEFEYNARLRHIFRGRSIFLWWTQKILFCLKPTFYAANPHKESKAKTEHEIVFLKKRERRSATAKPAAVPYQYKKQPKTQKKL